MADSQAENLQQHADRRRDPRFECDFPITVEWGAASLPGRVRDISESGMFVALEGPLWIGARFAAQLALEPQVDVECVVNRVDPRRGMAVTYAARGEPGRAALASLLQGLAAR